jgi:hypothetical protein
MEVWRGTARSGIGTLVIDRVLYSAVRRSRRSSADAGTQLGISSASKLGQRACHDRNTLGQLRQTTEAHFTTDVED